MTIADLPKIKFNLLDDNFTNSYVFFVLPKLPDQMSNKTRQEK